MTLEERIKDINKTIESLSKEIENYKGEAVAIQSIGIRSLHQLVDWLQELKERREKESRENGIAVEWIQYPSEDEQPPEGIEVLVTLSSGDVVVDFYSGSDFLTYGPRVVAWMRFPEPCERWCS